MININKIKTYPISKRKSKVLLKDFARPPSGRRSFLGFYGSLPNILRAQDLRSIVNATVNARRMGRAAIFMCGAHVIKCGLNPVLIELMRKKVITCIALNGAGIIHDFEVAFCGRTSEDVGEELKRGRFGMSAETADFLNKAVKEGVDKGLGLGDAVAEKISRARLPYRDLSLLYNAYKQGVKICVFIAIGTDIIHQHPSFDAAAAGQGSMRDFHALVEEMSGLGGGGVVLNFGSAVILPEAFLKALNLARNLGYKAKDFVTANFDMIYHYRPSQNVVSRPVMSGGRGYYIIGHHEIMLPLLAQAIIENLGSAG